jgi:hypothetical protein
MRGELTKAIWHDCVWLRVCLERLLGQLGVSVQPCADTEEVFIKELDRQYYQNMLFSLLPLQLSDRATELGGIYASSNAY